MILANRNSYLRENETDFSCTLCHGNMMYIQVLEPHTKIVADFFQCEACGHKVETREMQEEEFPAFYD